MSLRPGVGPPDSILSRIVKTVETGLAFWIDRRGLRCEQSW